ncbi:MAG: hypothetical protein NZ842_09030, partial [Dehalococcoidia bacterium]|nr:hypothetical protein [Dehalococcoidia bacterium]
NKLFGGVCVFSFGDLFQLEPVKNIAVYKKPARNPQYHIQHLLEPIWKQFTVINLKTNHRQGEDKSWADLLNNIRTVRRGEISEENLKTLKSRVRPRNHPDVKNADRHIVSKRMVAKEMNDEHLNNLPGEEVVMKAIHSCSTIKKYTPWLQEDGTIAGTGFCQELKLKIGSRVMLINNVDVSDKLTNGQMGTVKAFDKTEKGAVNFIMVTFTTKVAGRSQREKHPQLKINYPGATRVDKKTFSYSLDKNNKKGTGAQACLHQFPIVLAHAVTAHKCQGQTIEKPNTVSLDISEVFTHAQAYVMLGRAQNMEQVYIIDKVDPKKIYCSEAALTEVNEMEERSLDRNPPIWLKKKENQIKIVTLNIYNLHTHIEDLKKDHDMKEADLILISETWLRQEDEKRENLKIETYRENFVSVGNGKGLASYSKEDIELEQSVKREDYQIMKLTQGADLHIISAYRSKDSSIKSFTEDILNLISSDVTTVVTGDMNKCARSDKENYLTTSLTKMGFSQLTKEPTHHNTTQGGRILDHIYVKINETFQPPEMVRFFLYFFYTISISTLSGADTCILL